MAQLLIKLIVCPIVVLLMDVLSHDVNYQALYQPLAVGLVLAVASRLLEHFLLKERTVWVSSIVDFFTAIVVVYFSQYLFVGSWVTFFGTLITALAVAITEHLEHMIFVKRFNR